MKNSWMALRREAIDLIIQRLEQNGQEMALVDCGQLGIFFVGKHRPVERTSHFEGKWQVQVFHPDEAHLQFSENFGFFYDPNHDRICLK